MELQKKENETLLVKGIEMLKDPKVSTGAKAAAVGLVVVGAIVFIGSKTLDIMSKG